MENEILHILEKTKLLFWQFGIKSVSMDDIACELGISKKTLYKFVKDKKDLVNQVIEQVSKERHKAYKNLMDQNLPAIDELLQVDVKIAEYIKNYNPSVEFDLKKYYPEIYEKIRKEKRQAIYAAILNNLKKGIKEGLYREDLDIKIITKIKVWNSENMINNDMFTNEQLVSKSVYQQIMLYHLKGIVNEKGNKYLENKLND